MGNSGGGKRKEMRDMQTLDAGKNERGNAQALARAMSASTAMDVSSSAVGVRQVRAGRGEGDSSARGMARAYVIETGIFCPPTNKGGNRTGPQTELARIIESLEPDQSFLLTDYKEYKRADAYVGKARTKKFAIRKIAGQGWRVWRLS